MTRLKRMIMGQNPRWTLIRAGILSVVSIFVFGFWARPVIVRGISMEPTLQNGSIHFLNRLHYRWATPQRGDTVAVAMPGGRAYYMKRILGLPGEKIGFAMGQLHINGVAMLESYLQDTGNWQMSELFIPPDHYFIAGDNRNTPFSGHSLGLVHRSQLSGRLLR